MYTCTCPCWLAYVLWRSLRVYRVIVKLGLMLRHCLYSLFCIVSTQMYIEFCILSSITLTHSWWMLCSWYYIVSVCCVWCLGNILCGFIRAVVLENLHLFGGAFCWWGSRQGEWSIAWGQVAIVWKVVCDWGVWGSLVWAIGVLVRHQKFCWGIWIYII